ncbi:uncharacterized protein LOC132556193 [Ylistrum balloti]|uniref:uncharacterized protein LOC132556193 n=1 Tax=Ylistrum balloti TaxID=509963 RepID=UPI002905BAD5|nr:uncharacterized protein LOC132556193 [Ylistrum balloti]
MALLKQSKEHGSRKKWMDDISCYFCKEKGHVKKKCPKFLERTLEHKGNGKKGKSALKRLQMRKERRDANGPRSKIGVSSITNEAGMYMRANIQGAETTCLVDTGASLSLLSAKFYNSMSEQCRPVLAATKCTVAAARGSDLVLHGKGMFDVQIDSEVIRLELIVAEISTEGGIHGLDFLRAIDAVIDVKQESLQIRGRHVPLVFQGPFGCRRISVVETVSLPPCSEMIVPGRVLQTKSNTRSYKGLGVVEPTEKFLSSERSLVARTLVQCREVLPVRVLNPSNEPQVIYAGTVVGELSPAGKVFDMCQSLNPTKVGENKELQHLLEKTVEKLAPEQAKGANKLLEEYQDLFASSNSDLGHTDIVRHEIKTGDAQPIKQPLQ